MDKDTLMSELRDHHRVRAECRCRRIVEFTQSGLLARHGMRYDQKVADLAGRLKCSVCGARDGFAVFVVGIEAEGRAQPRETFRAVIVDKSEAASNAASRRRQ